MTDNAIAANANLPMMERVTFTYQKIQWAWSSPALVATDDWASPVT
jgi:type VI protein secretion system component Hcp